jgi:alkylhydroperoxidase/carboxymuconolactone decarboxylase family protein YurZ
MKNNKKPVTGNWNAAFEPFAQLDPAWTEKVIAMSIMPAVSGALDAKTVELVRVAVDVSCRYTDGMRRHIRRALAAGATREEIVAVLQLASMRQGLHTMGLSAPILLEELKAAAGSARSANPSQKTSRRKEPV